MSLIDFAQKFLKSHMYRQLQNVPHIEIFTKHNLHVVIHTKCSLCQTHLKIFTPSTPTVTLPKFDQDLFSPLVFVSLCMIHQCPSLQVSPFSGCIHLMDSQTSNSIFALCMNVQSSSKFASFDCAKFQVDYMILSEGFSSMILYMVKHSTRLDTLYHVC